MSSLKNLISIFLLFLTFCVKAQIATLENYNQVWNTQSQNSSESMPLGGGDIGANVWVEKGDLYFYFSRSGTFDEHNTLLKLGRVKVSLSPNPFKDNEGFKQELLLKDGCISISQNGTTVKLWVDVFNPVIHVDLESKTPLKMTAAYESWRYKNRDSKGKANNANSYKWAPQGDIITYKDSIAFEGNGLKFYHRNREYTVFDVAVKQQKMESVKDQMMNPLANLTFGGFITGSNLKADGTYNGIYQDTDFKAYRLSSVKAAKKHQFQIQLYTNQSVDATLWNKELKNQISSYKKIKNNKAEEKTISWWHDFWKRSFVFTENEKTKKDSVYQIGQNYQLFRYMLGCNAYGKYPTKFNGGLFTVDPVYTNKDLNFTPDFRNWGGGTMTAQNQRLVYAPMLKSGDFDMMKSQLDYYLSLQKNAELRSQVYWKHGGAAFTEQLENFALPNPAEYEWKRPADYDAGMEYNAWLEYEWDTVFEFCQMMIQQKEYANEDIRKYNPFIISCLRFFDEHYQYLAKQRGRKALDGEGKLVLYPGSGAETYKMAYNSNSTISALKVITEKLLQFSEKELSKEDLEYLKAFQTRIPPLNFREFGGNKTLAPAKSWERINNSEVPQLYSVFPWGIYGLGKADFKTALNTWKYDTDALKFRSHVGWKQDNIFAARLGLTEEAAKYNLLKMANSDRRFPAFWGPGYDWVPDHNWGGSGMIGMQEMLLQTNGDKIYIFPAWPATWDVHFKLHAPKNTTVEVKMEKGKVTFLNVFPKEREKDIVNLLGTTLTEKENLK
ncbi:hypothetical protein SAMN05192550_0449 [Flavobacterium glycines]|uniref:DUF5703 domain-containing protein n=1 Tax=Flavobacterium glycines TaxID=551990 RepID=A0A1B9DP78_9FLAO|nr:hypothetical protein FBGL_09605 [Flavobacterium glycines]GEL10512.1 hypothetical protein FGL01_12510 [Flavobacterium glycines]SDI65122.1 hypothetical protein SAMN05192550_0449 [Flavobacterium glycines]